MKILDKLYKMYIFKNISEKLTWKTKQNRTKKTPKTSAPEMLKGRDLFFPLHFFCFKERSWILHFPSPISHPSLKYLKYHSVGALCTWGMLTWREGPGGQPPFSIPSPSRFHAPSVSPNTLWFRFFSFYKNITIAALCCLCYCWPRNCNQIAFMCSAFPLFYIPPPQ